jgi:hypothetical protein
MRKSKFRRNRSSGCCGSTMAWRQPIFVGGAHSRRRPFCKNKAKFGGMTVSDAQRLWTLHRKNGKREKLLAEAMLDNAVLRDLASKKLLTPALRPGDIVIMDNLSSHKARAVRAAIRQAGARLFFLAPCSPHLDPIEQVFARPKHMKRKAQ